MPPSLLRAAACAACLVSVAACATAPEQTAGFLTSYEGLEAQEDSLRASIRQRRDDAAAAQVERLRIEPAVLATDAASDLDEGERAFLLLELERQVCYELSERFTVVDEDGQDVARVRIAATRITPTGRVGSVVSAAANHFIPGPIGVRTPGTLGGLAAEAELINAQGEQVAALAWARDATVVGTENPSLSRIGDAVQLAEPFGDMVGDAFAPPGREVRAIPKPDPCARYGPRFRPEGIIGRVATGLYQPELSGARAREEPAEAASSD